MPDALIISVVIYNILFQMFSYAIYDCTAKSRFTAQSNLNYSYDYLNQQLREKKVFDIGQVEFAVLEPNGKLSVQLKSQNQPLTPQDLHLPTKYEGLATEMVLDGQIIEKNLQQNSLSQERLYKELKKKGIEDVKEVAFAALSTNGNLYVDLYRD